MKKILLILLVSVAGTLSAQNRINLSYSVSLKENYLPKNLLYSTLFISYGDRKDLFGAFFQKVQKNPGIISYKLPVNGLGIDFRSVGEKDVYQVNGEYFKDVQSGKITVSGGKVYLSGKLIIDNIGGDYLYNNTDIYSSLGSVDFFETWEFDKKTGTFSKEVKLMTLTAGEDHKELMGFRTQPFKGNVVAPSTVSGQYNYSSSGVMIGDIFYYADFKNLGKTQEDVNEVLNMISTDNYHYIAPDKRYKLALDILEYAYNEQFVNGNKVIFADYTCNEALDSNAIKQILVKSDSIYIEDPETGSLLMKVLNSEKYLTDIQGLGFHETWYFDPLTFSIKKVVHGISIVEKQMDNYYEGEGEPRLHQLLYIRMKNEVDGKHCPFFGREGYVLSENKYYHNDRVYNAEGKDLTEPIFNAQKTNAGVEGYSNYVSCGYSGDVLQIGIVSGIDTSFVEDYMTGEAKQAFSPKYNYGLIDKNAKVVLPFKYKSIGVFSNGFAVLSVDTFIDGNDVTDSYTAERYGVVNESGRIVVPCRYDYLEVVSNKLIKVQNEEKFGLISASGKPLVEPVYESIEAFTNGAAKIRKDGKWGLVNINGKIIRDCNYVYVSDFRNGKAIVYNPGDLQAININGDPAGNAEYVTISETKSGKKIIAIGDIDEKGQPLYYENPTIFYGLAAEDGKVILPCMFRSVYGIGSGLLSVQEEEGIYGIYDEIGNKLSVRPYNSVANFSGGRCLVTTRISSETGEFSSWGDVTKYGFIDEKGNEIIPLKYDEMRTVNDNSFIIKDNYKYGLIDRTGKEILPAEYDNIEVIDETSVVVVKDGSRMLAGANGKVYSELSFDSYGYVSYGLMPVKTGAKWKLCDLSKIKLVQGEYDNIKILGDDKILVFNGKTDENGKEITGLYGICGRDGRVVLPAVYEKIMVGTEGIFRILQKGLWGYASAEGKIIVKPAYTFASDFSGGKACVYKKGSYNTIDSEGKITGHLDFGIGDALDEERFVVFVSSLGSDGRPDIYGRDILYGLADSKNKIIIPVEYNSISLLSEGICLVYKGEVNEYKNPTRGKFGLVSINGKVITEPSYNAIQVIKSDYHLVFIGETDEFGYAQKGKYGVINSAGKIVIPVIYDNIIDYEYGEDVYRVYTGETDENGQPKGGKYGFISTNGNVVLSPEYNYINEPVVFKGITNEEGLPVNGKYGIIDQQYKFIIPPAYDFIETINDNLYLIFTGKTGIYGSPENGRFGFADKNGKIIVQPLYDYIMKDDFYYNNFGRVFQGTVDYNNEPSYGKFGVIDKSGNIIIEPAFDYLGDYNTSSKYILAGKRGLVADDIHRIKYGFIDKTGKIVVPFKYDEASELVNGISVVYNGTKDIRGSNINGKYSVIDSTGKELLPFDFDYIRNDRGFVMTFKGSLNYGWPKIGKYILYDSTCTKAITPEYNKVVYENEDCYRVFIGEVTNDGYEGKGRFGAIDRRGNLLLPVEYDNIEKKYGWDFYRLCKNGKYGTADKSFNVNIPAEFEYIGPFHNGISPARKNGKWGFIDVNGKTVLDFVYDYASSFADCQSDGYYGGTSTYDSDNAFVVKDNNYFRINRKGIRTAGAEFLVTTEPAPGIKIVVAGPGDCDDYLQYGIIDNENKTIVPCLFSNIVVNEDGLVIAESFGKYSIWNTKGLKISQSVYSYIGDFKEGLCAVREYSEKGNGKYGYADKTGKVVIPCSFDEAGDFSEGRAVVSSGGKWFFIDVNGSKISEKEYDALGNFKDGLAPFTYGGKSGYINQDLTEIVPANYDIAEAFNNGYAKVCLKNGGVGKWGVLNSTGKIIINPGFDYLSEFTGGYFTLFSGTVNKAGLPVTGKWGLADSTGTILIQPGYDYIELAGNGFVKIFNGKTDNDGYPEKGKYGLADYSGRIVLQPEYDLFAGDMYGFESSRIILYKGPLMYGFIPGQGLYGIFSLYEKRVIVPCSYNWISYADMDTIYRAFTGSTKMFYRGEWMPDAGVYTVFDSKGGKITKKDYEDVGIFYNERALVKFKGKYGFIDPSGNEAVPCIYDYAEPFGYYDGDNATVEQKGLRFKIDKFGNKAE